MVATGDLELAKPQASGQYATAAELTGRPTTLSRAPAHQSGILCCTHCQHVKNEFRAPTALSMTGAGSGSTIRYHRICDRAVRSTVPGLRAAFDRIHGLLGTLTRRAAGEITLGLAQGVHGQVRW
jgi:hypothetical protein